jgi:hypothetical protein
MALLPLDAVITGAAFEDATTAIGVLEQGQGSKGKISTEMLCTLDNFVQAILFNERIFLTISPWIENGKIIPGGVKYRGEPLSQKQIESAGIFSPLPAKFSNPEGLSKLVDQVLQPTESQKTDWFVIQCKYAKEKLTIFQEMASMDAYLMEDAIAQVGVENFKPVFPGEHLYLGLRGSRLPMPRITQTMSDLIALRLRTAVRDKMSKLNVFVSQGAPLIPEMPPIYVSRILRDCTTGSDFVPVMLKIRNSAALCRLRAWMKKCSDQLRSADLAERIKAAHDWQKFIDFPLDQAIDKVAVGLSVLNVAVDIVTTDIMGIVDEVASPIVNYFLSAPFAGLKEFSGDKVDSARLDAFLTATFSDKFTRSEMNMISDHLKLPANLKDWADEDAELSVGPGRIYPQMGPLARSYSMTIRDPNVLSDVLDDYNALKSKIKNEGTV